MSLHVHGRIPPAKDEVAWAKDNVAWDSICQVINAKGFLVWMWILCACVFVCDIDLGPCNTIFTIKAKNVCMCVCVCVCVCNTDFLHLLLYNK